MNKRLNKANNDKDVVNLINPIVRLKDPYIKMVSMWNIE
jgi:hypothetical protein